MCSGVAFLALFRGAVPGEVNSNANTLGPQYCRLVTFEEVCRIDTCRLAELRGIPWQPALWPWLEVHARRRF